MTTLRLRPSERIAGTLWGLIVTGAAVTAMVVLSGYEVDTELVLIGALVILGGWLVISAVLAARPNRSKGPDAVASEPVSPADVSQQ